MWSCRDTQCKETYNAKKHEEEEAKEKEELKKTSLNKVQEKCSKLAANWIVIDQWRD